MLLQRSPDVLFMELTKVTDPGEIADPLTERTLIEKVYLHKIIRLVDTEHVLEYNSIFSQIENWIRRLFVLQTIVS
ncbi:hypothetical protein [Ammoniphilus sp. CFH 90114]|uniref:hypothetical protein n=1 Tax=Ammoniphilus sp. CFH 90114 TaxID=2493665 RepID=UPI00100ECAC9|nr:hypothetical protein [Ammoniphilus sp. CFH 90114]